MRSSIVIAAVALGLVACQADIFSNFVTPFGGGTPTAVTIAVGDSLGSATPSFRPAVDTISTGDPVRWLVDQGAPDGPYTVTWDQGPAGATLPQNSGDLQAGGTYLAFLSQPGWYTYHCTHHATMG